MENLKNKTIYVVGSAKNYCYWLINYGMVQVYNIIDADVVMFTGGEDVTPKLYGAKNHPTTYNNLDRDLEEIKAFKKAQSLNKFCIGICRGAQFLTVMSGGKLIQNVDNHGKSHNINFYDDSIFKVTSTHHQMMWPYELNPSSYYLLGYSEGIATKFEFEKDIESEGSETDLTKDFPDCAYRTLNNFDIMEPEVVYYLKTNSLCIQSHPEMMNFNDTAVVKFTKLVNDLLTDEFKNIK